MHAPPPYDHLPAEIQQLQLWAQSRPRRSAPGDDYMPEELSELYQHSLRGAHPLGNRPLVTIIGMRAEPRPANVSAEQWDALVQEKVDQKRGYRDISTNSKVVEDPIAGHSVHLDDPDGVVTAIRDVLSAAISGHRLH